MDNKQKIINYLGKNMESFTMRELSIALKIPYATFYRTINDMTNLIAIKQVGKSRVVSLNTENPVMRSYLAVASEEEKDEFLKKQPIIRKIAAELQTDDIVILFGSYAKGNEKQSSDIDLLIINKKGEKSLSFSKYEQLFKKKINPIFITEEEFREMLKDKEENVGKQALKAHIILNNPENFWRNVLNV